MCSVFLPVAISQQSGAVLNCPLLRLLICTKTACVWSSFGPPWFVLWSKSSFTVTGPSWCLAMQFRVENEIDKIDLTHHWKCHPLLRRNSPRIWHISTDYLPPPGTLVGNTWKTNLPATEPSFHVHVSSCHRHAFSRDGCSEQQLTNNGVGISVRQQNTLILCS